MNNSEFVFFFVHKNRKSSRKMEGNLVIVESPAKAHTIEKYLGNDFKVLASVGHIRKDTKVDKTTFDVTYEIDPEHKKIISELKKEAKEADKIWLATDEDREGESISWHLSEVLKLPKDTARITFHEITKPALEAAIKNPRTVDMDMVYSQQALSTLYPTFRNSSKSLTRLVGLHDIYISLSIPYPMIFPSALG